MIQYRGTVRNGVVVLEEGVKLPEGTSVHVECWPAATTKAGELESARDLLLRFAGSLEGDYPEDFAENHDHYIHGTPKRRKEQP